VGGRDSTSKLSTEARCGCEKGGVVPPSIHLHDMGGCNVLSETRHVRDFNETLAPFQVPSHVVP